MKRLIAALLCAWPLPRACAGSEGSTVLSQMGREMEELAGKACRSVVQVIVEEDPGLPMPGGRLPGGPFGWFQGVAPIRRSGSGFFISREGHILTTPHVVGGARRIAVRLENGVEKEARLAGSDTGMSVAVLKIEGESREPLALGDSDRLRPGSPVIVVGNPFGLSGSVSWGVVGGRGRTVPEIAELVELVQVNASINPGDSGGALIDARGEVVGILAADIGGSRDDADACHGICFAVPINAVKSVLPGLKAGGEAEHGWLGVGIQELTPALQAEFNVADGQGVVVARVIEDGPAARAGVKVGDVVRAMDGVPVRSPRELVARIAAAPVGAKASLSVLRNGREETLSVQIGRRSADSAPAKPGAAPGGLGIGVEESASGDGLAVGDVRPGSPASKAGLRKGDTIIEVNRKRIGSLAEWEAIVNGRPAGGKLLIRTQRGFFVVGTE